MTYTGNISPGCSGRHIVLRDYSLAENLVAETFLIMLCKRETLTKHPNIAGWLNLTLKNVILDELKSAKHRLEMPLSHDFHGSASPAPPLELSLPDGLSPTEKEILILLYATQLSYGEIAVRLGISLLNCRTRAFRAREHYRQLAANGGVR